MFYFTSDRSFIAGARCVEVAAAAAAAGATTDRQHRSVKTEKA